MALSQHTRPTVAIAVIGVPGSGKSTFIHLASGSAHTHTNPVRNPTTELASSTFSLDGRSVTLIDTPGFDDAAASSVLGVLKSISEYFSRLYSQGVKLAGVIYMHRVAAANDGDRVGGGPSQRGFRTFCKFCGDTTLRDVVIVTGAHAGSPTKAHADDSDDVSAHGALSTVECFANAIDKGARMLPHDGSQASAHAILRQLLDRQAHPARPAVSVSIPVPVPVPISIPVPAPVSVRTITRTPSDMRALTDQVEQHTKTFGVLCREIDAATACAAVGGGETKGAGLQEEAKDSLENIERIRHDLERLVTSIATENARLEDENRQFKHAFSTQQTEAELRVRLLGEERRARELAEVERGRAEARLVEERALWEREKTGKESVDGGPVARHRYGGLFACGAVVFVLVCASRFVLDGSVPLLP